MSIREEIVFTVHSIYILLYNGGFFFFFVPPELKVQEHGPWFFSKLKFHLELFQLRQRYRITAVPRPKSAILITRWKIVNTVLCFFRCAIALSQYRSVHRYRFTANDKKTSPTRSMFFFLILIIGTKRSSTKSRERAIGWNAINTSGGYWVGSLWKVTKLPPKGFNLSTAVVPGRGDMDRVYWRREILGEKIKI